MPAPLSSFSPDITTAVAGAATLNRDSGIVTSEALTTAAGATYTLTLACSQVTPKSIVLPTIQNGSNTQGDPSLGLVTPGNGVVTIKVVNRHASQAFNGSIIISFIVYN